MLSAVQNPLQLGGLGGSDSNGILNYFLIFPLIGVSCKAWGFLCEDSVYERQGPEQAHLG